MRRFLRKIKWYLQGKPMLEYEGVNCGACGRWLNAPISVPEWESNGKWWDTWGICADIDKCVTPIGDD